ncbi:MAG TPA: hypothetical protein V6D05_10495 [Stenomitos sp.]
MPPKASSHPIVALALTAGLAVFPTSKAFAASDRLIEYMNVTPADGGRYELSQGDRPIASDRFLEAIEQLDAAPAFTEGVRRERTARTTLTWSAVGLTVLAPVLGTLFLVNNQRNPDGVFTRTYLIGTLADAAAAAGVGLWAFIRHSQPLFSQQEAEDAALAYNRKLDRLEAPRTRP